MSEAEPGVEQRTIPTPQGDARVHVRRADPAAGERGVLLLQHGANGSIQAKELLVLATSLPAAGVTTVLLQQPFAVAGKKVAPRPERLDEALEVIVPALALDVPLVLGGRSSGARCACRQAGPLGAVAALALAFPLHPPGAPEKSRAAELLGCTVPTLVVQGSRDAFGGASELPDLGQHQRLVEVPGADHGFRVPARSDPGPAATLDTVRSAVTAWLDEVI